MFNYRYAPHPFERAHDYYNQGRFRGKVVIIANYAKFHPRLQLGDIHPENVKSDIKRLINIFQQLQYVVLLLENEIREDILDAVERRKLIKKCE